jgi:hypothetical protein
MTNTEIIEQYDPKELLLLILRGMDIVILKEQDKYVDVEKGYIIEIEGKGLYKLWHNNQVVAPFTDIVEMGNFIKSYQP